MNTVYLSLGSNQGNRFNYLKLALKALEQRVGKVESISSLYETDSWGFVTENRFINQVVCLKTGLLANDLLQQILIIEKEFGRIRVDDNKSYQNRTIDIDILFYSDEILNSKDMIIPHKYIQERRFILTPLFEIAPNLIHPVFSLTIGQLLLNCQDNLRVERVTSEYTKC